MGMEKQRLTQEHLRELLHYDPLTGIFTWLARHLSSFPAPHYGVTWNKKFQSKTAGSVRRQKGKQYRWISIGGIDYAAHHLATLYMIGEWPNDEVDHRDGDGDNNKWINLRQADRRLNSQNIRRARIDSSTGILGVSWNKRRRKFVAQIQIDGRVKSLGGFDDPNEAGITYIEAKRKHHEGCTI